MALFRRDSDTASPTPATETPDGSGRKSTPTPTRRQAEAARRQRSIKSMSTKEVRAETSRQRRVERMKSMAHRDATPEKQLMRDYIDSRFNIGEFLLPSLVVILAMSFLQAVAPRIGVATTVIMYVFILAVLLDGARLWRGFRKVLAARMPQASTRGLLMYGMNRAIQIRRFRMPAPRVKRGESY